MSAPQQKRRHQKQQERLDFIAPLYKKGWSIREIRAEAMAKLGLPAYSTQTVFADVKMLLETWRKYRVKEIDQLMELEMGRIDDAIKALWAEWEKTTAPQEVIVIDEQTGEEVTEIRPRIGDPRFLAEIRQQLAERRKLLGMYSPEKKEITGKDGAPLQSTHTIVFEDFTQPIQEPNE